MPRTGNRNESDLCSERAACDNRAVLQNHRSTTQPFDAPTSHTAEAKGAPRTSEFRDTNRQQESVSGAALRIANASCASVSALSVVHTRPQLTHQIRIDKPQCNDSKYGHEKAIKERRSQVKRNQLELRRRATTQSPRIQNQNRYKIKQQNALNNPLSGGRLHLLFVFRFVSVLCGSSSDLI